MIRRKSAQDQDECTCHIFDIGPRCNWCVRRCLLDGHPLGTHASGRPDLCTCGAPDGRYDAEALAEVTS